MRPLEAEVKRLEGIVGAASGVGLIAAERQRQIEVERFGPGHDDDDHDDGELAKAAAAYILYGNQRDTLPPRIWPWYREWWKPKDTKRNLVRAGALVAAELDRMARAAEAAKGESK
jgi:hypothetical protein